METKFILDGWEMSNLQPGLKSSFKCKPKTLTALKLHTWDSQSFSQTVNSELKQWVWILRLHEWQPEVWCLAWWTLLSHTMNLNAFVLTPAVRICWVRALGGRRWQPEVDIFSLCLGRQFSHCIRSQMSLPCPIYQQSNCWSMQNRFLSCLLKK